MIPIAPEDVCDPDLCAGCAAEIATGHEVWSGFHDCPHGSRPNAAYMAAAGARMNVAHALFGWLP